MKFSSSVLSSFVLVLPLLAEATPLGSFKGAKGSAGNNGAAASSAAAASASAAAASAAAASAAAASAAAATAAGATASAAAASSTAAASSGDIQSSLTLDPSVIATGFENNGQAVQEAGQVASLTSSNNFINFCATVPQLPITNGQQITTGSCNPAPMGIIAATTNMPSSKFVFPANGAVIQENQPFTISMAIQNLETGFFVNANQNYFSAPQQVNTAGNVQGHSHVVIDFLDSVNQTTPTNPTRFAFFKGLNAAASNGVLTADVTQGLPAGAYRLASINTAANHQPVLVAIAQHGALDDMVYFTVTSDGQNDGSDDDFGGSAATQGVPPPAASTAAAATAAAASSSAAASAAATSSAAANKAAASASAPAASASAAASKGKAPAPAPAKGGKGGNNAAAPFPFRFGGFKREMKSRQN
ncbi:hypothetical protein EIP86_006372 [Pleurotus ostreatoroseus]|nr:hypothetical protein EIP86_006372 [Pleurotus ostreatoroseus]